MSEFGDDDDVGELTPVTRAKGAGKKRTGDESTPRDGDEGPKPHGEGVGLDLHLSYQPWSDLGNAQRFIARHGDDFRHVVNLGWHFYDGACWSALLGYLEAKRCAQRIGGLIWQERQALKDRGGKDLDFRLKKLADWATTSTNDWAVEAMLRSAEPNLSLFVEALNADPFLAACPNGTLELGLHCEFRKNRRADYITRKMGIAYDPKATAPLFEKFIERVQPDPDMRAFLQRILGLCLTGSTREQKIFLFYGVGNNGKSTLMDSVREILGDYAVTSPASVFMAQQMAADGGRPSPEMVRLQGARLVTAAEPSEGARLDEAKIKEIASGEPIAARDLNKGYVTFKPDFKLVISTNHLPTIRGTDRGIWRRILTVPWKVEIPEADIDRELPKKLRAELPGILNWMLDGLEEYFAIGLAPPAAALAAVEDYRADQDPVGEFLKVCCVATGDKPDPATGEPYRVKAKDLLGVYKEWCTEEGLEPLSGQKFGTKLTGRGIAKRKSMGLTHYLGLVVKAGRVAV